MNAFSNSLFTFLFGWARSLIEGIWNAAAEGKYSSFFSWLGDHWLPLLILLCLIGTALDFLIWLIRWRPYLVWRSTLRRWTRALRGEKVDSQRRFRRGYRDAVDLGFSPQAEEGAVRRGQMPAPASAEAYPLMEEFSAPESRAVPEGNDLPEGRRRRSDRYNAPRKPLWHPRFPVIQGQDDEGLLDGLPPAVDRQQAFHDPVYPTSSPASWNARDQRKPGQRV